MVRGNLTKTIYYRSLSQEPNSLQHFVKHCTLPSFVFPCKNPHHCISGWETSLNRLHIGRASTSLTHSYLCHGPSPLQCSHCNTIIQHPSLYSVLRNRVYFFYSLSPPSSSSTLPPDSYPNFTNFHLILATPPTSFTNP